jgi:hypothetical protein
MQDFEKRKPDSKSKNRDGTMNQKKLTLQEPRTKEMPETWKSENVFMNIHASLNTEPAGKDKRLKYYFPPK